MKYKFALVNGQRQEAKAGLAGECQGCGQPMIAKCGPIRVKHWAHRGQCSVDPWREPETEWHRTWKNHFPDAWQEVRLSAQDGELHIADVKTDQDYVLEFQHSPIKDEERRARETFYQKMIWVVDATARKRDKAKFLNLLKGAVRVVEKVPVLRLSGYLDECALIRDWASSQTPVLFDFGDELGLWYLLPISSVTLAYVVNVRHEDFIKLHREGASMAPNLEFWFKDLSKLVSDFVQARVQRQQTVQLNYRRPRRHFRF